MQKIRTVNTYKLSVIYIINKMFICHFRNYLINVGIIYVFLLMKNSELQNELTTLISGNSGIRTGDLVINVFPNKCMGHLKKKDFKIIYCKHAPPKASLWRTRDNSPFLHFSSFFFLFLSFFLLFSFPPFFPLLSFLPLP